MREATHSTLQTIIQDRVNTLDIKSSLQFFGKRIQGVFPSEICCKNNGNYQEFIYNNIQYTSELALMMQDCSKFLNENDDLTKLIDKSNTLQIYQNKNNHKKIETKNNIDDNCLILIFEDKILNLTQEFDKINDKINDTVHEMNKYCSTLQELFQLKTKLGKQMVKFVKYHWK